MPFFEPPRWDNRSGQLSARGLEELATQAALASALAPSGVYFVQTDAGQAWAQDTVVNSIQPGLQLIGPTEILGPFLIGGFPPPGSYPPYTTTGFPPYTPPGGWSPYPTYLLTTLPPYGPPPLDVQAPLMIEGWLFWKCISFTFSSLHTQENPSEMLRDSVSLGGPYQQGVVVDITPDAGGTRITGITPRGWGLPLNVGQILNATNEDPIVLTVESWANFEPSPGDVVEVSGVQGLTAANGVWTVAEADQKTLTLQGSSGSDEPVFEPSPGSAIRAMGPQLLVLRNVASENLTLDATGGDSQSFEQFNFPAQYSPQLILAQADAAWLWWDLCGLKKWALLATTASAGGGGGGGGGEGGEGGVSGSHNDVVVTEPYKVIDFSDGGGVTWTITDDGDQIGVEAVVGGGGGGGGIEGEHNSGASTGTPRSILNCNDDGVMIWTVSDSGTAINITAIFNYQAISGYSAGVQQLLGHDSSGNLAWYGVTTC